MTTPAELLERALAAHGNTLYHFALLAGGDERAAEALLRDLAAERVAAWREAPPAAPPDEPELLAGLAAAAVVAEAKRAARRPTQAGPAARAGRAAAPGPLALGRLPLDQRLALGLYLLLGYDSSRIARVLGADEAGALAALTAAVRALGPAAGHALTDRVSGDLCGPVRAALADPASTARHGAAVRGHLAACSLCRSFDHAWGEILHAVEARLRDDLRGRALPPALAARLLAAARPPRRISPTLRLALPPLAVLALIAALVLPGFLQAPVSVVQREEGVALDPQELLARAVERHAAPPDRGGIWHGRYETQWFFDDGVYAPLTAEIWLDPRNPARHRLQLTHADGGAPYELQIGNGRNRLYYALDSSYAPAIYGNLPTRARPESPALLSEPLDEAGLARARDERLATGPWQIAPSYLRQAQSAADLRVLGRQRDRGRTVQILSFSGVSPLGLPPEAPGATAERVTVLLALDTEDGLLRSATELAGPAGVEQVSRVTWRLLDEQWLGATQQIEAAFDVGRAWTGVGEFSETGRHESADLAVPLIPARSVGDPARLLSSAVGPFWLPARAPEGVDRALLLWSDGDARSGNPPQGLVYLGPGRRMVIVFNLFRPVEGEALQVGPWSSVLRPAATNRYRLFLARERDEELLRSGRIDPSANVLIDSYGFSRDELLAVAESMRPFDIGSLDAQDELFAGRAGGPEARSLLIAAAAAGAPPADGLARYLRARQFSRQAARSNDPRRDPYTPRPYDGRPAMTLVEEWVASRGGPVRYVRQSSSAGNERYQQAYYDPAEAWSYSDGLQAAYRYSTRYMPIASRLLYPAGTALELLASPAEQLTVSRVPGGGTLFSYSEQAISSPRYAYLLRVEGPTAEPFLYDLRPITMTTELQLSPAGEAEAVRVYAVDDAGLRNLVASYEVFERGDIALAAAPAPLRDGAMPEPLYARDYRFDAASAAGTSLSLVTRTLTEALALAPGGLYLLDGAGPLFVEDGPTEQAYAGAGDVLEQAVGQRLATRLSYSVAPEDGGSDYLLRVIQGPAGPLGAFLRAAGGLPWTASEQRRLTIAGRELDAWVGEGERSIIVAELGGTLVVVEILGGAFGERDLAALAGMRLATRP